LDYTSLIENFQEKLGGILAVGLDIFRTAKRMVNTCNWSNMDPETAPVLMDALAASGVDPVAQVLDDVVRGHIFVTVPWLNIGRPGYEACAELGWARVRHGRRANGDRRRFKVVPVGAQFRVRGLEWECAVDIKGMATQWSRKSMRMVKVLTKIWDEGCRPVLLPTYASNTDNNLCEDLATAPEMEGFRYNFNPYWEALHNQRMRDILGKAA
jgi:hypothetical protein